MMKCETRGLLAIIILAAIILVVIGIATIAYEFGFLSMLLIAFLPVFRGFFDGHSEHSITGTMGTIALHDYTVCKRCLTVFTWNHAPFSTWREKVSAARISKLLADAQKQRQELLKGDRHELVTKYNDTIFWLRVSKEACKPWS